MENKKSLFKKKNVKKRAISLIVLMISIVIMIILATTAVVLVNNSGILGAGAELDFKNDVSQYNEKVKEKMGYITSSTQSGAIVSGDEMVSYVPEISDKYKDKLFILDGKLVLDGAKASKNEIKWANEIGVDVSTYVDISGLELEIGENDIIIKKVNLIGKDSEIKSYKFKIDGNDWITSNKGEYTFANLEVGKYYDIYVSLVLKDGSESREYKKHVKTDVVGDVVSIILSTQNWTKNALNVKLSYTNDLMDGYKIQYKISSSNWTDYTESIDKAGGFSVDENTTIYARLYNDSKKRETANNFIEIRNIDKIKPTVPTAIEVTSGINSLKVRASGAQDDLSGVAGYIYSIDGTKYTTLVKSNEEYTFTDIKANTNKVVYAKAVDSVGNESDAYSKDWSTWDAEEKVRMIPSETNWTNKDVTIALAHQSIPTDYIMQYKIGENGTWQNGYTILIKENVDIVYARLYNAKLDDTIGLNSMSVKNIDRLPPEMNKDVDYNPTKNSIITSNLKGIDRGGSGISHYELFIRKHGESNYKSYTTKENTYTFEGLVKDTLYDIRIRVYDNAGNVSDFVESSIPTVCTITLDSQGADSTKEGTKAIYEKYNKGLYDTEDCINEITSIEIPQKGEYTFDGYYTQTGGKGTKMIDENGNITSNFNNKYYTSAGTLYASWKSYTITYNFSENGGTECTKTSEMVKAGKTLDLTQGPTATKLGWKFIGWNTEVDKRAKLNSIVMERKNIVLYAQYSKDVTATCNYYGGTSAVTGTMWNKEKSISIKLPQISNATKDGVTYTKRGWAKEDTANADIVVNSGANVTLSDNAIYYANYQSSMNINIYYCSGDGTSSTSLGNTVDVATASSGRYMNYKGNFVYTSVTLPDVVKNSKGFCGTDYSGISKEKNSTTAATLDTSSTTYYAFYTKDVTLYYYNGSKHTSSVVKRNVTTDSTKYTSKEGSTIPTPASYDGATFKGWSWKSDAVDARTFNATAVAVLYAYYQKTITVSYDKNDGTGTIAPASGTKTYISKAVSTDASVALTTLNPSITVSDGSGFTRTGYVFSGWNTKSDGTGKNYAKSEKAEFSESTTLYAKWTVIGYNISYNLQNGTAGSNKPTSAKYDQVVTISNPTKTVTITGDANGTGATITGSPVSKPQTFAGWTYSGGNTATALYGTASNAVTTSWNNASTKVKAGYFKNLTATNNATVTMKANWTTAAIILPKATKTGYTVKWYKNTAGTGTAYGSGSSYSPAEGDPANITFYAKATANKYQVVYNNGDANSGTLPSNQDVYYDGSITLGTNNMKKNNTSGYTVTYVKGTATGGTLPAVQNQTVSYTANGWATSQNGNRVYTNGQMISPYKINSNLSLYPSWTATRGKVTLATNNMTKDNKNMGKITFNYNGNGQANTTAYAYTQFTANGWQKATDGTSFTNGQSITPTSNYTLVPNFTSTAKSPTFPTPTRTGYVFAGWYDGTGSNAKKYTSYNGEEDITLYAHWTKVYYQNTSSKKYYVTLNDAFSDAASGNTINVIDNATETKSATLTSEKGLTLNMNSKNITFNGAYGITNNGTLSIQGSGTISGSNAHVVHNVGVLNIEGGTITNKTNGTTRAIWNDYKGTVNMSSGTVSNTVTSTNMESNTTTPYAVANGGTFNLKGGAITSTSSGNDLQYGVYTTGQFNMSGGAIVTCGTAIYMANKKDTTTNGGTNITGGTIRNASTGRVAVQNVSNGTLTISGNNTISITSTASKGIYLTGPGKVNITAPNLTVSGNTNAISNKDTGTITISGAATFTATKYACVENEGTGSISIGAGTFNGKTYGINNKSTGTITVTGGTIDASGGTGISVGGGTLTLGKDDGSVSTTNPSITGSSIGMEGGNIKAFNFYDGVIISEGSYGTALHITATKTPTNYTVQQDDNGKKAYLRKNRSTLTIDPNGGSVNIYDPSTSASYTTVTSSKSYTRNYDSKIKLSVPTKKNASDTENYTVTYDYAGATGGNSTKTSSSAKTTVTKYTFNSWSGQGATAAPITKDTENGTIYYYYTFPKTEAATSNYIATYSQTQTSTYSSVTLPKPTKTGYNFSGWMNQSGVKVGNGGDSYTPKGSLTLHASWTIHKSTLTINPAGGSVKVWSPSSASSPVTIKTSTSYTQNYNTKLKCEATKGNTTSSADYKVTFNYGIGSGSVKSSTATKTITYSYTFDSWTKSATFYGSISGNEYTFSSSNNVTSTLTAKYNSTSTTVNGSVYLPAPNSKSGYTFQGWYTAASGGTRVGGAGSSYTVKSNTTLYAHWSNNSHIHSSGGDELLTAIPKGGNYKNYVIRNYHWSGTWTCTAGHKHTASTSKKGYYIACIYCGKSFYDLGMPASDGRWWCPKDANSKTGLNLPTD